jgi:hypothetical protein
MRDTARVARVGGRGAAGTEMPALALVSSRVAFAVRKVLAGTPLDSQDRRDIEAAYEEILRTSEPAAVRLPARHARSGGLIVSTARATRPTGDAASLTDRLQSIASDLRRLLDSQPPRDASSLLHYYQQLSSTARQQGRGGTETIIRPR